MRTKPSSAAAPSPVKPQPPPVDHPHILAVASNLQEFSSDRPAIKPGTLVQVEFTPSMVVVHDALRPSPCTFTKLGIILYSFPLDKRSLEVARDTGRVSATMLFNLLEIVYPGPKNAERKKARSECKYCGAGWARRLTEEEADFHIKGHVQKFLIQ